MYPFQESHQRKKFINKISWTYLKNRTKSKVLVLILRQLLRDIHFRNDALVVFYRLETVERLRSNRLCASRSRRPSQVVLQGFTFTLTQWFHHGRDCRFTRKSMMQNFRNYIKLEGEHKEIKFKKKRTLSSNVIWYSLLLRCNSLQTCQLLMKEFPFPSLSPMKNNYRGTTWCFEMCQTFKISRGDFRRYSIEVWWDIFTEMRRMLWRWNNRCKWRLFENFEKLWF